MKKLLICLTILFSTFLFTNSVNAISSDTYNMSSWIDVSEFTLPNNVTPEDYNIVIWQRSETLGYRLVYWSKDLDSSIYVSTFGNGGVFPNTSQIAFYYGNDNWKKLSYYDETEVFSKSFKSSSPGTSASFTTQKLIYSNVDIWYQFDNGSSAYKWFDLSKVSFEPETYNITLHLNGGIADDNNWVTGDSGSYLVGMKYEDYIITVPGDNLISYLREVYITKEPMQFIGWYYDEKLTQKVEATDTINSDQHFYAKYRYKNVEDFLNNTTFNSYTFDENYKYAVISLNNQQNRDIYLGLYIMSHNLEVYKYDKNNNTTLKGSTSCLTPIYSKNDKYYYQVSDSLDNTYEVLILEKEKLKGNYEILLSDNAYITYTNDLKNLVIKDDNGNDLNIDIEDSYEYTQDNLLNNENDLLEIFKDLITNKDNNVFSYFNQLWNLMKTNKLFIYFMCLIIGSLIILIIKSASR